MQYNIMELLTIAEAAEYLRLKERKLYELVSEAAIPCTKVTGRWLFPRSELDRWLASSLMRPEGMPDPEPPPIIGGSHDPLLEWALRESRCGLASLAEGSVTGIERLVKGEVVAAAIHLHNLDSTDVNIETLRSRSHLRDTVLAGLVRREQGLLVTEENPKKIRSIADLAETKARLAVRPASAGAQLLLLALLHRAKIPIGAIALVEPPCPTGPDVAQAIRAGRADCGIATRSVANAAGLGFIPLVWEQFDLMVRYRDYFLPPFQTLLHFIRSQVFAARAQEFGGYDTSGAGVIRYAP